MPLTSPRDLRQGPLNAKGTPNSHTPSTKHQTVSPASQANKENVPPTAEAPLETFRESARKKEDFLEEN